MTYEHQLDLTSDRLRQLPESRLRSHEDAVYALLDRMTERAVPRLLPRGWGDQILVIGREVPLPRRDGFVVPLRELRRRFDLTI